MGVVTHSGSSASYVFRGVGVEVGGAEPQTFPLHFAACRPAPFGGDRASHPTAGLWGMQPGSAGVSAGPVFTPLAAAGVVGG